MWSHESGAGSVGAGAAAANSRLSWCGVTQSRQPGTSSFSLLSKCQMTEHICYNTAWTQERASRRGDRENSIPSPHNLCSHPSPGSRQGEGGWWPGLSSYVGQPSWPAAVLLLPARIGRTGAGRGARRSRSGSPGGCWWWGRGSSCWPGGWSPGGGGPGGPPGDPRDPRTSGTGASCGPARAPPRRWGDPDPSRGLGWRAWCGPGVTADK